MRTLIANEIHQVSGAISVSLGGCYSAEQFASWHEGAHREAMIASVGLGMTATVITGLTADYVGCLFFTSSMLATVVGLATFGSLYPIFYADYELWPWNY